LCARYGTVSASTARRAVRVTTRLEKHVSDWLAVDADITVRDVETGEVEEEDRIRGFALCADASHRHRTDRRRTRHRTSSFLRNVARTRNREADSVRGGHTLLVQLRRRDNELHAWLTP
jgi:hypothetical protein